MNRARGQPGCAQRNIMKTTAPTSALALRRALAAGLCFLTTASPAAAQSVPCGATFGGTGRDIPQAIAPASDGGALAAGYKDSPTGWDPADGEGDAWFLKLDAAGKTQWTATHGGTGWDGVTSVIQTPDGGYLAAGVTGGIEVNLPGREQAPGMGAVNEDQPGDIWLMKLDSGGNQVWARALGRAAGKFSAHFTATPGGIILAAAAAYPDTPATDLWLIPLGPSGETPPDPSQYGGRYPRAAATVAAMPDGGAAFAAATRAPEPDKSDIIIYRLDSKGRELWTSITGTQNLDQPTAVVPAPDGGLVVAGYTFTPSPGLADSGSQDFFIARLDDSGKKLWTRTLPAQRDDRIAAIAVTASGTVLAAGATFTGTAGDADLKIVLLDSSGEPLWNIKTGTPRDDRVTAVAAMPGGNDFVIAASTRMPEPDQSHDFWIFRLDDNGKCITP